jgi:hypothetical protein
MTLDTIMWGIMAGGLLSLLITAFLYSKSR